MPRTMWKQLTWTRSGTWAMSRSLSAMTSVRGASFTCSDGSRTTRNGSDTQRQAGHDSGDTSTYQESLTVPARHVRPYWFRALLTLRWIILSRASNYYFPEGL